eukprot:82613_1
MVGHEHTCALSTRNKMKCFGRNNYGQLGYEDTNDRGDEANQMGDNLLEIDLGTNFIPMQIVTGDYHTCALSTANKVKCWGYNTIGQLGYEDTNDRGDEGEMEQMKWVTNQMGDNLLEIDFGSTFIPTQIAAGIGHSCSLSTTNEVKCFGSNWHGQLGQGISTNVWETMGDSL